MGGQGSGQQVDIVTMIELETGGREVKRKGEPPCYLFSPVIGSYCSKLIPPSGAALRESNGPIRTQCGRLVAP